LDFLNTRMRVNDVFVDVFESEDDVLIWLKRAGFPVPTVYRTPELFKLLNSARTLRESVRSLVERRKEGRRGDPSILNGFLAAGRSCPQLVLGKSNKWKIEIMRRQETVESVLTPVAEAAADLLTTADFGLVKPCEDEACVLWFFDQTKSHRRRWCSMERCGNRHKVAAYRARSHDQSDSPV
jgi:predicted RNA-binding Zn ribbon-like protein